MIDRKQFFKRLFAGVSASVLTSQVPARALSWLDEMGAPEEGSSSGSNLIRSDADWAEIQKHFLHDKDYHYLNSATLGLIPDLVIETLEYQYRERLAHGRYWLDPSAMESVARMIGAKPNEIGITRSTTHGINIVAQGLKLKSRDEVILTNHEHVGNALPWLNRARRDKIRLKVFEPGLTAAENLDRIASLITRRTRVIAIPHITCTTGTVMPLEEIGKLARENDLYFFVDGAHGPGMIPLDMSTYGCDFYASCAHKWLCGPAGSGFLFVKESRLEDIDPIMVGAYSDNGWALTMDEQRLDGFANDAGRFDYGTRDPVKHAGIAAAIAFMEGIGWERIQARQIYLHKLLRKKLGQFDEVEFLTPDEKGSFGAILGFRIPQRAMAHLKPDFRENMIRIREVHEAGLNSIRASTHIMNAEEDIDALVAGIGRLLKK